MSTSPELPEDPAGRQGTLAFVLKHLRTSRGLLQEEVAERTRGLDPDRPGEQAIIKQRISQFERLPLPSMLSRRNIEALARAFGVPEYVFVAACMESLGWAPFPGYETASSLLPLTEWRQLSTEQQLHFRALIVALARGEQ